jgi:hypothetical protein
VTRISLELQERYSRGRGDNKLIDTYTLGYLHEDVELQVGEDEEVFLPFDLGFAERLTAIDELSSRSRLFKPLGQLARMTNAASSTYTLVCTAKVKGVKLAPEARLKLDF